MADAASSRVVIGDDVRRQDAASTETPNFFDPAQPIGTVAGNLPHWRQEGVAYFVTFRSADALPQKKLRAWEAERADWLAKHPEPHSPAQRADYYDKFVDLIQ